MCECHKINKPNLLFSEVNAVLAFFSAASTSSSAAVAFYSFWFCFGLTVFCCCCCIFCWCGASSLSFCGCSHFFVFQQFFDRPRNSVHTHILQTKANQKKVASEAKEVKRAQVKSIFLFQLHLFFLLDSCIRTVMFYWVWVLLLFLLLYISM